MAYSELIKNFNRTREYMRQFHVFGFRSREGYAMKSPRSYDDEKRRVESWLLEYMRFLRTSDGKSVFLSIDSRASHFNPLYKAWKAKSFTNLDITLHFLILDILCTAETELTLPEIAEGMQKRLAAFSEPRFFDESSVRKKLKEYESEGLIISKKLGRASVYSRNESLPSIDAGLLAFFSEASPCGVIGSFIMDKCEKKDLSFRFKHHNIGFTMDDEIVCSLFEAMREKRFVLLEVLDSEGKRTAERVVPLKIMRGVQSARQYLMAHTERERIRPYRLDNVLSVTPMQVCPEFDLLRSDLVSMRTHLWGVSTHNREGTRLQRVEFTVRYEPSERHIHERLEREKRCGSVERIDETHSRFFAEVYDAAELIPWIRSFICRIENLNISDRFLEARFKDDLNKTCELYGLGGEKK